MQNELSFLTLAPPICVLIFACITKRVILSLLLGIILATFIAKDFTIFPAIELAYSCVFNNLELDKFFSLQHFWDTRNLFICIAILFFGVFVALMQHSGGAYAYALFIKKYIHSKKSAESSSLILSTFLFVDDYFNSLTVGSIMYPLTDAFKIPRVKLALLVHSLSAPLVILCPISSWVAAMLGYLRENGISEIKGASTLVIANPLMMYFQIIPFIFYSFILFFVVWYIVQTRISFASMKKHEDIAEKTGNLFGGEPPPKYLIDTSTLGIDKKTTLVDFLVPIIILIVCIVLGMLYSGDWVYFGGKNNYIRALQNSSAAMALFIGCGVALIICTTFLIVRKHITDKELPKIFLEGINMMLSAVIVLMLAWSFGDILRNELHTGEYLAKILVNSVNISLLPMLFFITATIITFTIGTAWGTAAMLFPIAIPMVPVVLGMQHTPVLAEIPMLVLVLGAILSGGVAGNHISPIADTTIMSATSTRTPVIDHIRTQLPYSIPIIIVTALGFILATYLMPYGFAVASIVPIVCSIILVIIIMHILHAVYKRCSYK